MTRKDFIVLADILKDHRAELKAEFPDGEAEIAFSRLMADIRRFFKARNNFFNDDRFTRAVYGGHN